MKGLGPFNHCNYNLYVRFPMKRAREMKLLCLFSSEIEIMLNHMVCFPPNHVYSPALHKLFFFTCSLSSDKINVFKVVF